MNNFASMVGGCRPGGGGGKVLSDYQGKMSSDDFMAKGIDEKSDYEKLKIVAERHRQYYNLASYLNVNLKERR